MVSVLIFVHVQKRNLLCSRRPLSLFNSFNLTDSFLQFLSFDLNFDRLDLAAGEKVAKQVSSLSPSLSSQFYRLTRKPGVEEVSWQIKDHFMEEEEKVKVKQTLWLFQLAAQLKQAAGTDPEKRQIADKVGTNQSLRRY